MYRDMMLCNKDEASKKLCEQTKENWPELFADNKWKINKCTTDIRQIKSGYELGTRTSRHTPSDTYAQTPSDDNENNPRVHFDLDLDAEIPDDYDSGVDENTPGKTALTPRTRRRRSRRIQFTNEHGVNEQKWVSPDEDDASAKITSWWRSQLTSNKDKNQDNFNEQLTDNPL